MSTTLSDDFKAMVDSLKSMAGYVQPELFGLFRAQKNREGQVITGQFLAWNYAGNYGSAAILMNATRALAERLALGHRELVLPLDRQAVNRALAHFPEEILQEATSDKHLNVQALQAMAAATNEEDLHYVVFVFDNEARVESIPAALLKLTCNFHETNHYMLYTDGLWDVLKPLYWDGDVPHDPDDLEPFHKLKAYGQQPNQVPPGLRRMIEIG